jgi:hypothetical protein
MTRGKNVKAGNGQKKPETTGNTILTMSPAHTTERMSILLKNRSKLGKNVKTPEKVV